MSLFSKPFLIKTRISVSLVVKNVISINPSSMMKQKKPEKLVESEVLGVCLELGLTVDVYDSKATFSEARNQYTKAQGLPEGTPDLMGCDRSGVLVELELKAPGKANLCSLAQHQRLTRTIESNGFAGVFDGGENLKHLYFAWRKLWLLGEDRAARELLLSKLPRRVYVKQGKSKRIFTLA